MLWGANWVIRAVVIVVVGIETFTGKTPTGSSLAVAAVAFAIGVAVMAFWYGVEQWGESLAAANAALPVAIVTMSVAVAFAAPAPTAGGLIALACVGLVSEAARSNPIRGIVVVGTCVVAVEVGAVVWSAGTASVIGYPLLMLGIFVLGRNRRSYLVQAEQSAAMLVQLEQIRVGQQQVAVLDERTRIAREVHDVLAHSLGALGIQIQTVRAVLTDDHDVDRAVGLLEQAQRLASDGLVETRRAVQALRGDDIRLDRQLASLSETHKSRHGTQVDLSVDGDPESLGPEATVALARTAQEALVNAAKHAPHQPVRVTLRYDPDAVHLLVANAFSAPDDAGTTFSSLNGGYGLTGMRERLLLLNGSLTVGPRGDEWMVDAMVPVTR